MERDVSTKKGIAGLKGTFYTILPEDAPMIAGKTTFFVHQETQPKTKTM